MSAPYRRHLIGLGIAGVVVAACQALLDFENAPDKETPSEASAPDVPPSNGDAPSADVGAGDVAADGAAGFDAASLCNGAIAHFPFDGTLTGAHGRDAESGETSVDFVAGHVGQGVELVGQTRLVVLAGLPEAEFHNRGSIAFWAKVQWSLPCTASRLLFKLQSWQGPFFYVGPDLNCVAGGSLSLNARGPAAPEGIAAALPVTSEFGNGKWSHVVATWDRLAKHLFLMVNGAASAQVFKDWPVAAAEPFNEVMLGYQPAPLNGILDRVTFWSRELTLEEAKALFEAGQGELMASCFQ